jgi:EAL domain-containing protein (putative c-di-GMP-specific phosphodiesterase class I)
MEALIRWNDPQKGEIFPKDFIFVAEELGLIVPIGEWVFRTACQQLKRWEEDGLPQVTISINISPRQFMSRKLVSTLLQIVRETGANPRLIELEITETMIMRNVEQSIETLSRLRSVGMLVAVDDFGVGYSSLSQLKRLPASSMKIDRSFIMNVPEDASSGSITEAIIAMSKRLKLRCIAEGRRDAPAARLPARQPLRRPSRATSSPAPSRHSKPPRCSRRKPPRAWRCNSQPSVNPR